jgi:hypothetical protein
MVGQCGDAGQRLGRKTRGQSRLEQRCEGNQRPPRAVLLLLLLMMKMCFISLILSSFLRLLFFIFPWHWYLRQSSSFIFSILFLFHSVFVFLFLYSYLFRLRKPLTPLLFHIHFKHKVMLLVTSITWRYSHLLLMAQCSLTTLPPPRIFPLTQHNKQYTSKLYSRHC